MGASIGVTVGVNGESEYERSLKNISAATRAFQSELREVQSAFDANNDLGSKWAKSSGILSNEIDAQKDKISKLKTELETAKEKFGENSTEVYRLETQLNNAGTALHKMEQQLANGNIPMLERAASETKLWQSELSKVQSGFTDKTSAWTKSQSTASVLSGSIGAQEQEIKLLEEQVRRVGAAYGENSQECNNWKIKLNEATAELNRMKQELDELPNRVEALGEDWKKAGDKIQKAGKSVSGVGDTLSKVSVPIAAGLGAAIKTTADFESEMAKAWSVTGALDKSLSDSEKQTAFDSLSAKAREMGEATKFTAAEAADAIYYMGLAGWDTDSVLAGLSGVMNLAAASGEDLARTSDIVTDSLTAFGETAEMSNHFADVMAATMANSNTTVDLLGESFKYVGAVAGSFGYSIDDVALGLGLMANAGVKGSQAGTGLRQAIQKLTDPTEKTASVMKKYGVSLFDAEGKALSFGEVVQSLRGKFGGINADVEEMSNILENDGEEALESYANNLGLTSSEQEKLTAIVQLFGTRALPGVLAMIDASEEDYNKLAAAIAGSSDEVEINGEKFKGAAAAMSQIQLDNFTGQVTILKSKLAELAISFGEQMMPTLMKLVDGAQKLVDGLNGMSDGTKEAIIKAGLFVAAVGPILSIGGRFISGIGTIISGGGELLQLIGGLGGGAKVVAGGMSMLAGATGGATAAAGGLVSATGKVVGSFGAIGGAIGAGGGGLIGSLGALAAGFAPFLIGGAVVAGIGIGVYEIIKHWDSIKEGAAKLHDWLGEKFSSIREGFASFKDKVVGIFSDGKDKTVAEAKLMASGVGAEVMSMKEETEFKIKKMQNEIAMLTKAIKDDTTEQFGMTKEEAVKRVGELKSEAQNEMINLKIAMTNEASEASGNVNGKFSEMAKNASSWGSDLANNFKDGMSRGWEHVKQKASDLAQGIKNILGFSEPSEGPLSDFHTYAPDMMSLYAKGIDENSGSVERIIQSVGASISSYFNSMKDAGWESGIGLSNSFAGGIESTINRATSAAESMKSNMMSVLSGIAASAQSWGSDLANNLANGIGRSMGRAVDAAKNLAYSISSYLHFSKPDIGPLSDFHTWMPDMMKQLASGIYSNMGQVDKAINSLAMKMALPTPEMSLPDRSQKATSITNGDIVVNVYGAEGQDVRELARIVEQEITFNMNRRSAAYA